MLTINLLPEEARKGGLSTVEQFHRTPLMLMAVGVMVGLTVLLSLPIPFRARKLAGLNAKISALEPRKLELDRLQRALHLLRAEEATLRGLGGEEDLWSKRLNTLSNVTPDGVWFTELTIDKQKGLVIQGSAIAQADPEMVNVTRFVQELKADPGFAAAVKDVQIESIKRMQDHDIEIVQFTLACELSEPGKAP